MCEFFGEQDAYYFHKGTHYELYKRLGAHVGERAGDVGTHFAVYAPHARSVSVIGDFDYWDRRTHPMERLGDSGVYYTFLPNVTAGARYKYSIEAANGDILEKADPFAFMAELRPRTASVVASIDGFSWTDGAYMASLRESDYRQRPMAVYEVHLGSWKKDGEKRDGDRFLDYRRLAHELCDYVLYMGYTHIELMGIAEHPYDGSWGYQVTGYFAPTSRYGTPSDLMYFINHCHTRGIGVILDWVPAHFPKDAHGLMRFDGEPLFEPSDSRRAEYPEWGTLAFDTGKPEVSNFLIASALFWAKEYHVDALRVDAVAAMLYHDFSRSDWLPNIYGGTLNLENVEFFRHLSSILSQKTAAILIAEDSSGIPGVTEPAERNGLGFALKWNMGWMNDTLRYIEKDPIYRRYHHNLLTHTVSYAFSEHFLLALSHDEVVYGKHSLLSKLPGNFMDKFGGLKCYYTLLFGFPGKKLLFMGQDFGQWNEWNAEESLDWHLADADAHRSLLECTRALLQLYKTHPVLYSDYRDGRSFEWVNGGDAWRSIFSFFRRNPWDYNDALLFVLNFTPSAREDYAVGVPHAGSYRRIFTSYPDASPLTLTAREGECDGRPYRIEFSLRSNEAAVFSVPYAEKKKEK